MGFGFGERLRGARVVSGVTSNEELARRCGLPVETVDRWVVSEGEAMTVRELLRLQAVIRRRGQYLLDGEGPVLPLALCPETVELMLLLDRIPQAKRPFFIAIGTKMADMT